MWKKKHKKTSKNKNKGPACPTRMIYGGVPFVFVPRLLAINAHIKICSRPAAAAGRPAQKW